MKRYSYVNCMAECRAVLTYDLCKCLPMRYLNNGSFPSCGMESIFCIMENINVFTGAIPGLNETILRRHDFRKGRCECLPDCELNLYPTEVASADLIRPKSINKTAKITNKVIAHIYFNDMVSTRYRKDIFQDWIQLLATFGGLLGLIMGFSFVTAFEFIYFLTIRPLFDCFANNSVGRS
ncbi:pickpocket protein 11-like [Hermetia illucens]|uniref:pickpocket protein 11-like n=1 Tax=Hermetia illucens TaxID=343691 RepID=UPI0018CC0621|nr:pickpocket protein 11-like [Hermetia illucens]